MLSFVSHLLLVHKTPAAGEAPSAQQSVKPWVLAPANGRKHASNGGHGRTVVLDRIMGRFGDVIRGTVVFLTVPRLSVSVWCVIRVRQVSMNV